MVKKQTRFSSINRYKSSEHINLTLNACHTIVILADANSTMNCADLMYVQNKRTLHNLKYIST